VLNLPVQGIHIVLPIVTPSQNVYQRWHWAKRGQFRDNAQLLVRFAVAKCRLDQAPVPVRAVVRVIRCGPRLLDIGNLVGGAKPLMDALVRERVIQDDSPRWVEEIYLQEIVSRGREHMKIWVYPAIEKAPEP